MKIINSKMYEFYTEYKVQYKGKNYMCNYNGGLPKLNGINLSEKLRCELSDIIEDNFLKQK
tara:strand:+ start:178 stop:360 length:183 start_codon:yes stop_codon:yes gene_type:complete